MAASSRHGDFRIRNLELTSSNADAKQTEGTASGERL